MFKRSHINNYITVQTRFQDKLVLLENLNKK